MSSLKIALHVLGEFIAWAFTIALGVFVYVTFL